MLLWTGGLIVWGALQERRTMQHGLRETARALSVAVDQGIRLSMSALESAAVSRTMVEGDLSAREAMARRLRSIQSNWAAVMLFDPGGRVRFNTALPAGMPPDGGGVAGEEAMSAARRAMATGRPAVSGLVALPGLEGSVIQVAVPVRNANGVTRSVLSAAIRPERLGEMLDTENLPEGWFVAITDADGTVISQIPPLRGAIGRPAPDWVRAAMAQTESGMATGVAATGGTVTISYTHSPLTGWNVVFGAPSRLFDANLQGSLAVTTGFGLAVLAGSLLLARTTARRILRPVQALTEAARPFIPENGPGYAPYGITELDALHRALDGLTAELAKTQERFLTFFSAAPVMLFVLDREERLLAVNDAWLRVMGYERHEVMGRAVQDFHTPDSAAARARLAAPEFQRTGVLDGFGAQYVTKAGEVRDVLVSLRADRQEDGTILRTIGAVQDVTEQLRAEARSAQAVAEAERANESKTRFLAAASHDLRQPLQALSLYLGVMKARLNGREEQVMEAIGQCVESLSGLLNDMLDVARLEAGIVTPKPVDIPVSRLLERVAAAWRIQAETKGLRLDFVTCDVVVRTDPALMDRVLSNLVANAVRYTESGRILVGCRRVDGARLRIEVWDTGLGIPGDKLGEIFEEFRQLGNPERRRDKGTGLGLSIVKRIAGLLDHPLVVRSVPGRGSVFAVTLPVAGAAPLEAEPPARNGRQARRILVVDDEIHVRTGLQMVLGELGHRVEGAETLEEAVMAARRARPELVIADFRLAGGRTGVDVIRAVRASCGGEVPAVVLTGDTDPATIRSIVDEGLSLLHKPLRVEALQAFLRKVA
jgi:PAS domain S-box